MARVRSLEKIDLSKSGATCTINGASKTCLVKTCDGRISMAVMNHEGMMLSDPFQCRRQSEKHCMEFSVHKLSFVMLTNEPSKGR